MLKKLTVLICMLLMLCLSSCGNTNSEQPITQDVTETQATSSAENTGSSDANISQTEDASEEIETDLDVQKQQKVLDIADTLISKNMGVRFLQISVLKQLLLVTETGSLSALLMTAHLTHMVHLRRCFQLSMLTTSRLM